MKPSLHYSKLDLHFIENRLEDSELTNHSGVAAVTGRQEIAAEAARQAVEGFLAEQASTEATSEVAAAAGAAGDAIGEHSVKADVAVPKQRASSGGGSLVEQGVEEASLLLTAVEDLLVASDVGCFSDGESRLGCFRGCSCHWYQRCYPRFVEEGALPAGVAPGALAFLNATVAGTETEMVNAGRCGLGVLIMTFASVLGFLLVVFCIVVFRAGTLAMEAVKEQAAEGTSPSLQIDMLSQLRAEAEKRGTTQSSKTQLLTGNDDQKRTALGESYPK